MKVPYTNILLLYAVNLSILLIICRINIQKNHYINVLHTSNTTKIPTTRLLCECDLYTSIYDNDPEMKAVMQQFDRQTSQRFEEYNERMQEKRQTCKEQCEKDIQKIILKDKIEKELTEKFATLQTDITTEDIPTCVCEKSVADKVENTCLKCGGLLGGGVAPSLGLLGEIGGLVINNWTNTPFFKAFVTFAEKKGLAAGAKAGDAAGVDKVIELVNSKFGVSTLADKALESFFTVQNYSQEDLITESLYFEFKATCLTSASENDSLLCFYGSKSGFVPGTSVSPRDVIGTTVKEIVKKSTNAATQAADTAATETTNGLIEAEISKITSAVLICTLQLCT
ncbi:rifin, partial [Plasmodium falciparum RAJ116]